MDLRVSPEQAAAREAYAAWLDAFLPADYYDRYAAYRADPELRRAHQRAAFDAGWLVPAWPRELGGHDLGAVEAVTVRLEAARRGAPKLPSVQSVGVIAPALKDFGTEEQRAEHLVPALRGDVWWALGMSEPGAGSDLAALRTRAEERDGALLVNGQKIWTTQAHESRWCMLYCRTDRAAPRHRGISCLLVDLTSPGITIRPIEMGWPGADEFCEVFFDDVEVPREQLVGAPGEGWRVAMASLNHERDMIWVMNFVEIERGLGRLSADVRRHGRRGVAEEVGRLVADAAALRLTGYRALTSELRGQQSPEFHILKLLGSESLQRTWELALAAAGPEGACDADLLFEDFDALGATIYGGTSEIQRNIIGDRILGLPR